MIMRDMSKLTKFASCEPVTLSLMLSVVFVLEKDFDCPECKLHLVSDMQWQEDQAV